MEPFKNRRAVGDKTNPQHQITIVADYQEQVKKSYNLIIRGENSQEAVIQYLNALLRKYPNQYLEESTFLAGEKYI